MRIEINHLTCLRCNHQWIPRKPEVNMCPTCKSLLWDKPKKRKRTMKMQTVKEFFERNALNGQAVIESDENGTALLWVEGHEKGLTVVDCNSSVSELGYRDESDRNLNRIRNQWLRI